MSDAIEPASRLQGLAPLVRLLAIMRTLREPGGCPWDRAQTFATIAPYTIEEAYEVADAVAQNDLAALRDELGDLLLQVVFHARIAEELGAFGFAEVAEAIADKLERRHPHIFDNGAADRAAPSADRAAPSWEAVKAAERAQRGAAGALAGVARALPALLRADKLQRRAARTGFDWRDPSGPAAKLREEIDELAAAPDAPGRFEEAGDVLFTAANLVRAHGICPEEALRAANAKFERRFAAMEAMASTRGADFAALPAAEQQSLWNAVKQEER